LNIFKVIISIISLLLGCCLCNCVNCCSY